MEQAYQRHDGRHLTELALEAVWVDDEQTDLDAEHARRLSRLGLGPAGRFPVRTH